MDNRRRLLCAVSLIWFLATCGGESQPEPDDRSNPTPPAESANLSPDARPDVTEMLRESVAQPRHPSDGGGRAWLEQAEGDPAYAVAGTPGRFTLVYEVGPEGIAAGGTISLQVSPFWGWSTPQVEVPQAPGYTTVTASADDIELDIATLDQQLLGIGVGDRPLVAGDRIRIVYGAGEAGAVADRLGERNSRFWFAVDGDGDGARTFLEDSPGIDVHSSPPVQLIVTLPSIARRGQPVRVVVALLDGWGSAGYPYEGSVTFEEVPVGMKLAGEIRFEAADRGRKTIEAQIDKSGVFRLRATTTEGLTAQSNPMLVAATAPRILWADLHGHSSLSDGTGTPEDYFLYARDVAALDVVALTDHDHWGILPLDDHAEFWEEIQQQTRRFHAPGSFVTLLGYEWTSWLHGHRHVLYFEDEGVVYSSIDPAYETPTQLWNALRGKPALTLAHHSAGGPIATNWNFPPDPILEPVTEIVSVHGSSEAADSPIPIYSPQQGNFVRDVLDRGFRFGFVGSGDSHDGHPGLAHLGSPTGGLAAILSENLTRESVLEAIRARRVYATSGPRIILRVALDQYRMGTTIPAPGSEGYSGDLFVQVLGTEPLDRIDLIRSGTVVDSMPADNLLDITLQRSIEALHSGEYLYVRAVQVDHAAAWSSPIYVD
ncbi:MAG: CehA/McbA family metallohydrolase [Myxococcota bacterium]